MVIFKWLRNRRRRQLLAEPFPEEWDEWLADLPFVGRLPGAAQSRLRSILRVLVAEKTWEGCGGLQMTDRMKVVIAAQAALLLLGVDHDHYRRVREVLVYPGSFVTSEQTAVDGLAWHRGPVILAWDAVRIGGDNWKDGRNVVLHEFAHRLDMLDNWIDGTPPLADAEQREAWVRVMTREFEDLKESERRSRPTLLDKYGTMNPAEFFAVCTEAFFEKPEPMRRRHPELYALLATYFGQDPADW